MTEGLPLLLSDGTNSYIYGPGGLPVEQINGSETPTYLHHDQQDSTRLLTGSAGTVTGKCTYTAYGTPTCEGTTTTPLGYDSQYASTDTGLIYMRARVYDPATAQFLTVDPMVGVTRAPYNYAGDNPLNEADPSGKEGFWETTEHLVLGAAGIGDTLATGITTFIATPICFAAVSAAPVIGEIAGYPACAVFAVGGAAFTAYEAYETYWEFDQAFNGPESGPAKARKETAVTCQPPLEQQLVSPL
jgi:RHS repeat-associated protein